MCLSALSVWEITIKYRLGRLPLPESPELFVASRRQRLQIEPLPYDERRRAPDVCRRALLERDVLKKAAAFFAKDHL